jgi:putative acetyltransferase
MVSLPDDAFLTSATEQKTGDEMRRKLELKIPQLGGHEDIQIMGLAPMAVLPANQKAGIGTKLVRAGLKACKEQGVPAAIVLGHPDYYPKFGFRPASTFGLDSEYEVPDDVFMAIEIHPGALEHLSGRVYYHELFSSLD